MTTNQEEEFLSYLMITGTEQMRKQYYKKLVNTTGTDPLVRQVIAFHILGTKDNAISDAQEVLAMFPLVNPDPVFPDQEEIVEDAGLYESDDVKEEVGASETRNICVKSQHGA